MGSLPWVHNEFGARGTHYLPRSAPEWRWECARLCQRQLPIQLERAAQPRESASGGRRQAWRASPAPVCCSWCLCSSANAAVNRQSVQTAAHQVQAAACRRRVGPSMWHMVKEVRGSKERASGGTAAGGRTLLLGRLVTSPHRSAAPVSLCPGPSPGHVCRHSLLAQHM